MPVETKFVLMGPSCRKLYLVSNKIAKIENVSHLRELQLLELGDNRIRAIENLEGLENLKELYIGKNKIAKIDQLACCPKLRKVKRIL